MSLESEIQSLMDVEGHALEKPALAIVDQAVREQHPAAFALLQNLLTKDGVSPFIRAALASYTRAFPNRETEHLLLSILAKDENLVVRSRVCDVLMQVGSEGALRPLENLASSWPEDGRFIAGSAHVVIAHRLGSASQFLKLPAEHDTLPLTGRASSFASRPLSPTLLREVVTDLDTNRFRLGRYSRVGAELRCSRGAWALVLHDHVVARGLSDCLRGSPSILGVVARQSEEHRCWSVARIILGGPLGDGKFYVSVIRRDGQSDLSGIGRLEDRMLELGAANRPGGAAIVARCYWYGNTPVVAGIMSVERVTAKIPRQRSSAQR
jgi:hypothetical protein